MCEKCETTLAYGAGWRLWNTRSGGFKSFLFCSLDCLSRWVEAQRLIAPVEERCVCCRGIRLHVPHPGLDVFQLRTAMRMAGWDCFGGDWFCPRHVEL